MKMLTVRLPDSLISQIENESRSRRVSKSDIVRERLTHYPRGAKSRSTFDAVADLIGSIDDSSKHVSANKKRYLRDAGYGRRRPR